MNYFRDLSGLHDLLGALYEKAPSEARRAELSRFLEGWGFTPDKRRFMLRPCSAATQRGRPIGLEQMHSM